MARDIKAIAIIRKVQDTALLTTILRNNKEQKLQAELDNVATQSKRKEHGAMKKTEAKEIAKEQMLEAIGIAYYKIADSDEYTQEEADLIIEQMNILGERMAKAIKGRYVTY